MRTYWPGEQVAAIVAVPNYVIALRSEFRRVTILNLFGKNKVIMKI